MNGPDVRDERLGRALGRSVEHIAPELDVGRVLRRGSRRRALRFGGSLAAVVLFVGAVAGAAAIVGDRARDVGPTGGRTVPDFDRTAEIGGITSTSPSDWFLVDQAFGQGEGQELLPGALLPILQLTNFDPGLDQPVCGRELPPEGAALSFSIQVPKSLVTSRDVTWPTELVEVGSSDCGPGQIARFFAPGSADSPPFLLWVSFGDRVSSADRQAMYDVVGSLGVSWGSDPLTAEEPSYVLAGGSDTDGAPWLLELRPTDVNAEIEVLSPDGTIGVGDFTVPAVPIEGTRFGAVSREASAVEFRPRSGEPPITATLLPPPPTVALDANIFFFAELLPDGRMAGDVTAIGLSNSQPLGPSVADPPQPSILPLPPSRSVFASGDDAYAGKWRLFVEESEGGPVFGVLLPGAQTFTSELRSPTDRALGSSHLAWASNGSVVLVQSIALHVDRVEIRLDDGTVVRAAVAESPGDMGGGPFRFAVAGIPSNVTTEGQQFDPDGTVVAYGADGQEIGRRRLSSA